MQLRRLGPWPSLGTSKAFGGISRVVANYQSKGITAGPTGLVDYLLDDRGDVRGLVSLTYSSPVCRNPHHLRCSSGPAGNIVRDVGKRSGIGIQLTLDEKTNSFCAAFYLITLELNIRLSNAGTLRNTDIRKAQTYNLRRALAYAFIGHLQVTAAQIHTAVGDTLFRIVADSVLPHSGGKDHICTGQSKYQNKRS